MTEFRNDILNNCFVIKSFDNEAGIMDFAGVFETGIRYSVIKYGKRRLNKSCGL